MAGILDIYSPDDIMNDVLPRLSYAPMDNQGYAKAYDLARPYTEMASRYGYGENPSLKQGLGSDVRHTTGSALAKFAMQDYLKNNFGVPTDSFLSDKLSNLGIYGSTAFQEVQDAYKNVRNLTGYGVDFRDALDRGLIQPMEDVTANIRATNIPYGTPVQEIINYAVENSPSKYMQAAPQIFSLNSFGPQNYETPQEKANNNFLKTLSDLVFTPAGAAEMQPIEDLRTMPLGTQETFGEKLQPTIPSGGSIFTDRFKNFNQRVGETGIQQVVSPYEYTFNEDVLKEEEDAQYNLPEKSSIFSNILDAGLTYATGLPFVGRGLEFLRNQFEYRPAEFGVYGYKPEQLNRMNALGGYYSEPMRAYRQQQNRVTNMLNRAYQGKTYSATNLQNLGGGTIQSNDSGTYGGGITQNYGGQTFTGFDNTPSGIASASAEYGSS